MQKQLLVDSGATGTKKGLNLKLVEKHEVLQSTAHSTFLEFLKDQLQIQNIEAQLDLNIDGLERQLNLVEVN